MTTVTKEYIYYSLDGEKIKEGKIPSSPSGESISLF